MIGSYSNTLVGFADADWGRDKETRRSTTGFVFFMNGGPVAWRSRVQKRVALSTAEAEYMAVSDASRECVWLRRILKELGYEQQVTVIWEDNQACVGLTRNDIYHERSKHIDLRYHFIREQITAGTITVQYVPTDRMIADVLTKPLARVALQRLRGKLLGIEQ